MFHFFILNATERSLTVSLLDHMQRASSFVVPTCHVSCLWHWNGFYPWIIYARNTLINTWNRRSLKFFIFSVGAAVTQVSKRGWSKLFPSLILYVCFRHCIRQIIKQIPNRQVSWLTFLTLPRHYCHSVHIFRCSVQWHAAMALRNGPWNVLD